MTHIETEAGSWRCPSCGVGDHGDLCPDRPIPACQCRSWVYDPMTHGPSPFTASGHHPVCPNREPRP